MHRGRTTRDALPATVFDLAAREHFDLEEVTAGQTMCRLPATPRSDRLAPFETRIMSLLRERAVNRTVPTDALSLGIEDERAAWWHAFTREVAGEARVLGFTRGWSSGWYALALGGAFLVAMVLSTSLRDSGAARLVFALALAGIIAVVVFDDSENRFPLTIAGRRAARRWRGVRDDLDDTGSFHDEPAAGVALWGRHLAYATALGLAPRAAHDLPIGPDSAHSVAVVRAGMWRHIPVHYPRRVPPGWGRHPIVATAVGAAGTTVIVWILVLAARSGAWHPEPPFSSVAADVIGDLEPLIAGIALGLLPLAAWELLAGLVDLASPRQQVTGTVVARWVRQGRRYNPWADLVPRRWYLAVDDGATTRIRGWRVPEKALRGIHRGNVVTARISRRLAHVRDLEVSDA